MTTRKSTKKGSDPIGFDLLNTLTHGRSSHKYAPEETIFLQGEPADAVYYISEGQIRLRVVSEQGRERTIASLGAGDFFGEKCLTGQPLHMASAVASSEVRLIRVQKSAMVKMLREDKAFAALFTEFLLSRNVRIEEDLIDQLFNSSEKRLARLLIQLANLGKDGKMEPIPRISQELLAAQVGTTRSRVNHFMNKFRERGLIEYNGDLKVHSALINVVLGE